MGVGLAALKLYVDLAERGILRPGQSVLELGSQDFVPGDFDVAQVFSAFGLPMPSAGFTSSRNFMVSLGYQYSSIDLDGNYGAAVIDLNTVACSAISQQFDVVTNHGTSEHIFNQENCFRFIHHVTKVGGIIIHIVPIEGYQEHCFYCYTRTFFQEIALANDYEIIRVYGMEDTSQIPGETGVLGIVVLRKTSQKAFAVPIQSVYQANSKLRTD